MACSKQFKGWSDALSTGFAIDELFAGPLAWPCGPSGMGHESRHPAYRGEAGKLCWDVRGENLVKVVDWAKTEDWGERVLVVSGQSPRYFRGISFECRQSKLVELSSAWQGGQSLTALRDLDDDKADRIKALVAAAWRSRMQAKALSEEVCDPLRSKAAPRI